MKPSTNALLLLLQIAALTSSSLAAAESLPSGITCADSSSLQLNECLTVGEAICSPSEGWAFGIDPADQRIKLWHGDQVRFIVACLFCCVLDAGEQKKPSTCIIPTRRRTWSNVFMQERRIGLRMPSLAYLTIIVFRPTVCRSTSNSILNSLILFTH